jgi:hypothetical protein
MTFKDLKKRISISSNQQQQVQSFDKLQNKPFWIWDIEEHKLEDIRLFLTCHSSSTSTAFILRDSKSNHLQGKNIKRAGQVMASCVIRTRRVW